MRPLETALFNDGFQFVAQHFPRADLHDRAVLTYFYARRRIGVAVKGASFRLRDPLPSRAEKALDPFRDFVRFVEAKRSSVKYDPNQPRVPAGNTEGGQWTDAGGTDAGGGGGRDKPANRPLLASTPPAGVSSDAPLPIGQVGFSEAERKMTAQDFISRNCKGYILREFPSEFLGLTLGEIEGMASSTKVNKCLKLLREDRFRKGR